MRRENENADEVFLNALESLAVLTPALWRACGYPAVDGNIAWDASLRMYMAEMQRNPRKPYIHVNRYIGESMFTSSLDGIFHIRLYMTHLWKLPLLALHRPCKAQKRLQKSQNPIRLPYCTYSPVQSFSLYLGRLCIFL